MGKTNIGFIKVDKQAEPQQQYIPTDDYIKETIRVLQSLIGQQRGIKRINVTTDYEGRTKVNITYF